MTPNLEVSRKTLYETDYLQWLETTARALRSQNYAHIDWENLIEEIEDMGRTERRRLESNLVVVLLHLLKWQYQPEARTGSWKGSITEHRRRLRKALKDSPSLKSYFVEVIMECYEDSARLASDKTGLSLNTFPVQCPYLPEEILEVDFFPE